VPVHRDLHSAYKYPELLLLRQEPHVFSTNCVQKPTTKNQKRRSQEKVMLFFNDKDIPGTETQK
jgi:hypothetical protein